MLEKLISTIISTLIPFIVLLLPLLWIISKKNANRNSDSSQKSSKKQFRRNFYANYYDTADNFKNPDIYENIEDDDEEDDDFSFDPRRMTNREYDDYFGTLYDDAMNGDEAARNEMRSEFGDNWKDEF